MQTLRRVLGDIEVTYRKAGEGEPVVCIHGLAEDHTSFDFFQDQSSDIQSFAYDLRGHGKTTLGNGNGTLAQLSEDFISFLTQLTGPAACIGYSLGGVVLLNTAVERPDLIRRAIVVATSTVVGSSAAAFFSDRISILEHNPNAFPDALAEDTKTQVVTNHFDIEATIRRRLAAVGDGGGYINAARVMIAMHSQPLTPRIGEIQCRVDVIGGDGDVFCPRKAADIILQELRDEHYHEIAGAGHLISVDQPIKYAGLLNSLLNDGEKND